jgi:CxxC motif-containing protein (DUF1111 family)
MNKLLFLFVISSSILLGCKPEKEITPQEDEDLKLGGETSISGAFIKIFQQPAANLNATDLAAHREADKAFGDIFVTAPNFINGGLGPVFNQNSCENCHISNGRSPFPTDANDLRGFLMRISLEGTGTRRTFSRS